MAPVDEPAIQRSIETIPQLPDEKAREGLILCKARLRDDERRIERLEAKLDKGPGYRGYSNDRIALKGAYEQRNHHARLVDAYQQDLDRRYEHAELARMPAERPEPPPSNVLFDNDRKSRPSEEVATLARELAKVLRETSEPRPARLKTNAKKKPKAVKPPSQRDTLIYSVIKKGSKGPRYAQALTDFSVQPSEDSNWKEWWPGTYKAAYGGDEVQKELIRKEKDRVKRRVEKYLRLSRKSWEELVRELKFSPDHPA